MGSIPQLSIVKGRNHPLYPRLLHKTFEELVDKKFGERDALIFQELSGEKQITNYYALNSTSNRIANALLEKIRSNKLTANREGDWIVCVCMKPSDDLIVALLSIWKCGGILLMHIFMSRSWILRILFLQLHIFLSTFNFLKTESITFWTNRNPFW